MRAKSFADMQCSIARALEDVGAWWSLLIIRDAMMGARRFKHFERSLGIAKNTLATRLAHLVERGILEKQEPADGSRHDEYVLTPKGRELAPLLMTLAQWGDKWAVHPDGPTFAFTDGEGEVIPRVWPRREDGQRIELHELRLKRLVGSQGEDGQPRGGR
ncbi:MAG: helix-turn-helix domain-containing protein [Myxococcota bacterium]